MSLKINIDVKHIINDLEDTLNKINETLKNNNLDYYQENELKNRKLNILIDLKDSLNILEEQRILIENLINDNL